MTQADVYQMMAYARLYSCRRLMLLYPAVPGSLNFPLQRHGISGGPEMLAVGRLDVAQQMDMIRSRLRALTLELMESKPEFAAQGTSRLALNH